MISLQVNEPIDPGTVNSTTLPVTQNSQVIPGTYSVSTDGRTITFVPNPPLAANASSFVYFMGGRGIVDLAGNLLVGSANASDFPFTTGSAASANQPQILASNPANGATSVPTNVQIMVQFNEPVDSATLGQITLSAGSGSIGVSKALSNGNQNLILTPISPLQANTPYTLSISGVTDLSGNLMLPATVNFTTGNTATLIVPSITSVSPGNGATNVSASAAIQVTFNKPMDPLTVTSGTFYIFPVTTDIQIAGTITVSPDGITATLTPILPLDSSTTYVVVVSNGVTDMAGRTGSFNQTSFVTGSGTIAEPPTIATVYPSAQNSVGSTVYVRGAYFGTSQGSSTVTFNGVTATPTSWSDTQIAVPVPSGATSGPLVVTVNGVASNNVTFTVFVTPTISNISPGTAAAGTVLTITGSNFGSSFDTTTVGFTSNVWNGTYATAISHTETSLTVAVPMAAESGNIVVYVNGYPSAGAYLTVTPTPVISSISSNSGTGGTELTVDGSNFGSTQGTSTLNFNGVPASIIGWTDTYIIARVPANATTGPVTVVANSITSNSDFVFTVTNPAIGSIDPPAAAASSTITLNGSGLTSAGLTTQVLFNGVVGNVAQSSSTSLTVNVPSNATSGPVTVMVGNVSSNSLTFTVEQPPTITSVTPNEGPFDTTSGVATPITITGSGFGATQSNSTVQFFGSANSANIQSWSDTSITAWVPADAVTGPIVIDVGGLDAITPSSFTVDRIAQLTDSLGNQTQYAVEIKGATWVTATSQGSGCSTCNVRGTINSTSDANGNLLSTTDELGHTTTYTYDSNNNVASESKQLDSQTAATTSYTYNSFGEVLTSTDPLGNTTTNTYDAHGNLLSVTSPAPDSHTPASVTQFAYDTKGELTQITDPLGHVTTLTYNPVGLIATITDAQSNVTTYGYDAHGNRTSVTDALHNQTLFAYDTGDRLTTITYPGGSTVSFGYDSRGRRTSVTDQNGKTTTYTYDDADRMTAVTDPAHNTTQYAYDTENNLTSITDANGHVTSFTYDAFGRVTQTAFPSSFAEHYAYDAVGNLTSKTDRKGQTIQYVYDALNRLTQKDYPDSTGVDYVYDLVGKIRQVTDSTGVYGFAYDNMGRLIGTTTQYSFLPGQTFTNVYTYDAASNRTSFTAPNGSTDTYAYDSLNRLNALNDSQTGQFSFGYDALSHETSLLRPNGVNTAYSYDALSNILNIAHQTGSTSIDGGTYGYDSARNVISKLNKLNNITEDYSYDALYRLTGVTHSSATTESYAYDPVGNRLSSVSMSPYNYNSSNELLSTPVGSYTYDPSGNMLTKPDGTQYSWDVENRLISVALPNSGGTVSFSYDPFGRRIHKVFNHGGITSVTNYVYDQSNHVEEVDAAGNVVAKYAQGPDEDEHLSQWRSGIAAYYDQDILGSVTALTSATGTLTNTYTYNSFGQTTNSTGDFINPFQYTGREFDEETGLYYYRARYYDPAIGRFINEDPLQFTGGMNFYSYVGGNPTNFIDPSGQTDKTHVLHGYWCGPNWTGGQKEQYDPAHDSLYKRPKDPTDTACMHHDKCYYSCRRDHPCDKGARETCMRQCDYELFDEAPHSAWGDVTTDILYYFNKHPDAGSNESCGCKQ